MTVSTVKTASGAEVKVQSATETVNGMTVTIRQNAVTKNAQAVQGVQTAPVAILSDGNITVGYFMAADGQPLATGKTEVYQSFDENGNLVQRYVDANGFFLTGVQVINGVTVTLNDEGVVIG